MTRKGVDDAIAALAELAEVELVVAGGPPRQGLDSDPEIARLRAVARAAGVAERVSFVGALGRDGVADLLHTADIAVCVPWYEPFGIVPLEAMACGVPVVGSAVGGLLDTVADGHTGVLVPPRRPDRVAAAVRWTLADPARHALLARNAAARARERFTWRAVANATYQVYEGVLLERDLAPSPGAAEGVVA